MRVITANLPISYINAIKGLTGKNGIFPSRSELVRVAIREFLINELKAAKSFEKFQQQTQFSAVYPLKEKESKSGLVKIPLKNSQGVITGYKTYSIVNKSNLLLNN